MEEQENISKQSREGDNSSSRMNFSKLRIILLVAIAGLIGYSIGVAKITFDWRNFQPHVEVVGREPPPSDSTADFSLLWQVLDKLSSTYYDKEAISEAEFVNGAIEGLVSSLGDPYTVYLPPAKNDDFKDGLAGRFEGIGAQLDMTDEKQIIVVAPLDGSPAKKAGLRAGDIILKVDSDFTNGWDVKEAVEKIRGEKGTEVILTVLHKSEDEPREVAIIRDTITIESVTSWLKRVKEIDEIDSNVSELKNFGDSKVEYVRLSQFGDNTNDEWQKIAAKIDRDYNSDKDIKGMVLDLRNNPGGYLIDAVYIASEFIKSGVVVSQEDREKNVVSHEASGKGLLYEIPLVVLINAGSASASEIVTGALRDHDRAIVVGEKSFGKGTIQQAEDLGGGAGLHVTIAKWLTPSGDWVHQEGIEPDITVEFDPDDPSRDTQLERAIEELVNPIE